MGRYLLAASPLTGHVAPMLQIGADLRRRGHDVRMLSGADYCDAIRDAGLEAITLPAAAVAHPPDLSFPRSVPLLLRNWLTGRADIRSVFIAPLLAQHQALQAALGGDSVDAVLVDIAFVGAIPLLLGDDARPPVLVCGVGPLMLSSADTPPFGVGWQPRTFLRYRMMNRAVHRVLFADVQRELNRTLRAAGRRRLPMFITDWPILADRLLQLTVPEFEYPRRDLAETVVFTGPVLPGPAQTPRLPDWWNDLDGARAVVLVTQGTWDNSDLDQLIGPTVRALADQDCLVIATTGRQVALGREVQAGNARVVDYVPYSLLMPYVDVMITNGGYGGVHYALANGVPLIVAGDTADKPEIAARVAYTGAGIDLKTGKPSEGAIAAAVRTVLNTPKYRAAAQRLSQNIAASHALDTIAETLGQAADTTG